MTPDMVFASIRQGELPADEAWTLLAPLVDTTDSKVADRICDALRGWVWKALDRRRRDAGLRDWMDVLNRVEAFFVERFAGTAAKVEALAELVHESLAVARLTTPEALIRRKHVAPILRMLGRRRGAWVRRAELMILLGLKPANTTRLLSLLLDVGLVEQAITGREVAYRISSAGSAQVRALQRAEEPRTAPGHGTREWSADAAHLRGLFGSITPLRHVTPETDAHRRPGLLRWKEWDEGSFRVTGWTGAESDRKSAFGLSIAHAPLPRLTLGAGGA